MSFLNALIAERVRMNIGMGDIYEINAISSPNKRVAVVNLHYKNSEGCDFVRTYIATSNSGNFWTDQVLLELDSNNVNTKLPHEITEIESTGSVLVSLFNEGENVESNYMYGFTIENGLWARMR